MGNPASSAHLDSIQAVTGVTSEGFAMTQLPAAKGGSDFPREQIQRQVPRRNAPHNANGFAVGVVDVRGACRGYVRVRGKMFNGAGKEFQVFLGAGNVHGPRQ